MPLPVHVCCRTVLGCRGGSRWIGREVRDGRGPRLSGTTRVEKDGANSCGFSNNARQRLVLVRVGQLGPVRSRGKTKRAEMQEALSTRQTLWGCSNLNSSASKQTWICDTCLTTGLA
jgi:hypothetical protein